MVTMNNSKRRLVEQVRRLEKKGEKKVWEVVELYRRVVEEGTD